MKILIYADPANHQTKRQLDAIQMLTPYNLLIVSSHDEFKNAYSRCLAGETIVVYFIGGEHDMAFLEGMHSNFLDIKLLLNLECSSEDLLTRSYRLKPRIVIRKGENLMLLPVMIRKIQREMNRTG